MKKIFSVILVVTFLGSGFEAKSQFHTSVFSFLPGTYDITGAIGRALQAAVKFFLSDDNKVVAELVYDGADTGKSCSGGCGGAYTGANGSVNSGLALNAVASTLTDIPAEASAYTDDIKIKDTSIADLAEQRIKSIVKEQAGLDQLSQDRWSVQYRAQQRAIQAMTDALTMKQAYADLATVANGIGEGNYADYSAAASTVATRRLLLDSLMALRKRVIAARVRARAETMEANLEDIGTAPAIDKGQVSSEVEATDTTDADEITDTQVVNQEISETDNNTDAGQED